MSTPARNAVPKKLTPFSAFVLARGIYKAQRSVWYDFKKHGIASAYIIQRTLMARQQWQEKLKERK